LTDAFMFNGWTVDRALALQSIKDSLKTLIKKWEVDTVNWMVQNLEWSSLQDLLPQERQLLVRNVQSSVNQIIERNKLKLKLTIDSPYFKDGKLKTDWRWGEISTQALVQLAKNLPWKTTEAPKVV
jgi:hypothetical protein